jgi:hypothetical protein
MSKSTISAAGGAMPASGHTADHPDAALFALAEECAVAFREREKVTDHLNAVEAEFEPVPAPAAIKKTKRDFELGLYLGNANFDYDKSEIAAIRTLCRTICHRPSPSELDLERFRRCKEVIGAWTAWQDAFTREKERSGVAAANRAWDEATDKSDDIAERLARMPAATIEGVLAKARATQYAFIGDAALGAKVREDLHLYGPEQEAFATSFARDLIRIVKSEGAAQ